MLTILLEHRLIPTNLSHLFCRCFASHKHLSCHDLYSGNTEALKWSRFNAQFETQCQATSHLSLALKEEGRADQELRSGQQKSHEGRVSRPELIMGRVGQLGMGYRQQPEFQINLGHHQAGGRQLMWLKLM